MDIVSRLTGVRIRDELIYIMDEEKPFNAIWRLYDLGALSKIGISREIEKEFVDEMRKALSSSTRISSYDSVEIMKWRMLLAMMLEGKTSRSIESWCLKMKIKKRDMSIIKNTAINIASARKEFEARLKDDQTLYNKIRKYPPELHAVCHSWGGGYAKNIRRYYTRLAKISLDISGEDLKEMGYIPSPAFKKVLDRMLSMKLNGKISGRKDELEAAASLMRTYTGIPSQERSSAR